MYRTACISCCLHVRSIEFAASRSVLMPAGASLGVSVTMHLCSHCAVLHAVAALLLALHLPIHNPTLPWPYDHLLQHHLLVLPVGCIIAVSCFSRQLALARAVALSAAQLLYLYAAPTLRQCYCPCIILQPCCRSQQRRCPATANLTCSSKACTVPAWRVFCSEQPPSQ